LEKTAVFIAGLQGLSIPCNADPVSDRVGNVRNNDPALLERLA
jgi:hypothetical protein